MANALSSMSNNPVQPNPIPIPPMPAEIHQAEQRAQEWLKQHEDVPQLLSRKHLSLGKVMALLFLVVTLPLSVWLVSQQQQLAELRSQARETAARGTENKTGVVIENQKIMPDMYRYLAQKYLPKDATSPVDLTIKVVKISEPNNKISGVAYFKYDEKDKLTYVFSQITGLPGDKEGVPRLWTQWGNEYRLLGEMALTSEPGGTVGYYSSYDKDSTLIAFDFLIVSYDSPGELKTPQSIVAKVSTTLTGK